MVGCLRATSSTLNAVILADGRFNDAKVLEPRQALDVVKRMELPKYIGKVLATRPHAVRIIVVYFKD
jgi:hypothetical protein